jgi:hypothetical protein
MGVIVIRAVQDPRLVVGAFQSFGTTTYPWFRNT